jgi:threonine/homoserine/homoserine lactone efflux protein
LANEKALGAVILLGSVLGIVIYGSLLLFFPKIILEISAFLAVVVLLGILGWIGWTMATTPAPEPMPEVPQSTSGAPSPVSGQAPSAPDQGTPKTAKS